MLRLYPVEAKMRVWWNQYSLEVMQMMMTAKNVETKMLEILWKAVG
jgi:hypothetical protein